jgi:uncharacterized membrane protein
MMRGYRDISPRFADDIMDMAVEDARSRAEVRREAARSQSLVVKWGGVSGAVLPILGLILAFITLMFGHQLGALIPFIPAALGGIAKLISAVRDT